MTSNETLTREPKDFAIEFGEYLATAAEQLLDLLGEERALRDVQNPDGLYDHIHAVRSAIYEFRKRTARAAVMTE